jgi:Ni,Fe-hydrogenase I large subunit
MQKQKIDTALIADFSQAWRDGTAFLARLQKMLRDHVCDEKALAALTREVKPIAQAWDHFCARHVYGVSVLNWQGETNSAADETLPVMRWFRRMAEDAPTLGRAALSPLPLTMFRSGKLSWQALVQSPYDASAWWRVQQDSRMVPVASRLGNSMAARLWARFVDVAATLAGLLEAEKTKASKVLMLNAAESNASSNAKKSKEEAKQEEKPWFRFHSLGDGIGMAEIECARGVLVHRAQLEGQNVVAYEVCAPTDWNLRRDGALSTLIGWPAADVERLRAQAIWLVQALDPCVAFDIEVAHA